MSKPIRDYLHAIFISVGVAVGIVGIVILRAAVTLNQYIGGGVLVALGGIAIFFAYRLDPKQTMSDFDALQKSEKVAPHAQEAKREA